MGGYTQEQTFFNKHVTFWYELCKELDSDWKAMNLVPELPPFSAEFDGTLNELIPALNTSFENITNNLLNCGVATGKMGDLLLETGKSYGVTEEQAEELADVVNEND
ncbi:hypothetical protein [Parenemella sanctibonifatiensis]|uniref:Uncharacterized protein n=1 Tax=Parenemella sanctibonifatiensis TaxID=2016505 RepID=A0A255EL56_9ACTN|nr:hypothetical protein [Parenemella sanctibonifatiensis]OYN88873.1 hypothetical protein CGZ92_04005 [Parenemella sanctibonifatiensis]